jgi:hypothetical protein
LCGSALHALAKSVSEFQGNPFVARIASTTKGKASPLFAAFAKEVADSIDKMLVSDNTSVRLSEMVKALPHVTLEEDYAALRRIDFALAEHGELTSKWRSRLLPKRPVVPLKLLKKAGGSLR